MRHARTLVAGAVIVVALAGCGGDDQPSPGTAGTARPAVKARAAVKAAEQLDPSVCRRRDLGQWDREVGARDFAPRCMVRAAHAAP